MTSLNIWLEPLEVTAKVVVSAVVADKASLEVRITFVALVLIAADGNVRAVPATFELLVTLTDIIDAPSLQDALPIAFASLLPEGSEYIKVTLGSTLTVLIGVSSTIEPETDASVTLLLEPPEVMAKAGVAAVVSEKVSL